MSMLITLFFVLLHFYFKNVDENVLVVAIQFQFGFKYSVQLSYILLDLFLDQKVQRICYIRTYKLMAFLIQANINLT